MTSHVPTQASDDHRAGLARRRTRRLLALVGALTGPSTGPSTSETPVHEAASFRLHAATR